jgi:hypothetical protein
MSNEQAIAESTTKVYLSNIGVMTIADHPPLLQRHKGFIYATAHVHDVDEQTFIQDGRTPVGIDAGFEVAPGDASDIEVANAHAWGSNTLIFSNGEGAASAVLIARLPFYKGIASYFSK